MDILFMAHARRNIMTSPRLAEATTIAVCNNSANATNTGWVLSEFPKAFQITFAKGLKGKGQAQLLYKPKGGEWLLKNPQK